MKRWIPMLFILAVPSFAEELATPSGELSLPWESFQKILGLGQDKVSLGWEEFQRLVKQTGAQEMPPFQMQNGRVILSRAEFKSLLDQMKLPASDTLKAFVTQANYSATIGRQSTTVTARLLIHLLGREGGNPPLRVPLFSGSLAFREVLWDGKPALLENDGSTLYVLTTKPGDHVVQATFSVASSLDKLPRQLDFPVPRTAVTEVNLVIPKPHVEAQISGASSTESHQEGDRTRIQALLPPTDRIQITWNPIQPQTQKGPAKVYAMIHNLLSVEEDALRVRAQIELQVLQNTINSVSLRVPKGYNVLDVQGESVGDWSVRGDTEKVLVVPLAYGRQGSMALTLTAERILKEKSGVAEYDGFEVLGAVRENGFVGVELKTTAEAKLLQSQGAERVDPEELPPALSGLAQRPLLFGLKYLRPPFAVELDIQRHEAVAVVSTVIDQANGVSLLMKDGKRVTHLTYSVRNSWKQFLEVMLPPDAQVWSAFVGGRPVRPSKNAEGKLLIPLNRSRGDRGGLTPFDVELLYYQTQGRFWPLGVHRIQFPVPDIVVSQAFWSVYLPVTHDYLYFGGNVDKEERATGFRPLLAAVLGTRPVLQDLERTVFRGGYVGGGGEAVGDKVARLEAAKNSNQWRHRGKFSESQSVDEDSYARQVEREMNFFQQVQAQSAMSAPAPGTDAGVLPIRINVPRSGQVYRFTQRVLVDSSPLRLYFIYMHRWAVKVGVLLILWLAIRKLWRSRGQLELWNKRVRDWLMRHDATLRWSKTPAGTLVATVLAAAVLFFVSRSLFGLAVVVLIAAAFRFGWATLLSKRMES